METRLCSQVVLTVEVPQEDGMDTEPSQEDPGLLRFCTEVLQAAGKSTAQVGPSARGYLPTRKTGLRKSLGSLYASRPF